MLSINGLGLETLRLFSNTLLRFRQSGEQGHEKRFPVYHDLLTARTNFLLAALAANLQQLVRLDDEDPEVFSLYLNCVNSKIGSDSRWR